jgi:hypothetical protein
MFVVGPSWGLRVGVGFFGCPRIPAANAIIHLAQPSPSIRRETSTASVCFFHPLNIETFTQTSLYHLKNYIVETNVTMVSNTTNRCYTRVMM